jgi:hypothetical protein
VRREKLVRSRAQLINRYKVKADGVGEGQGKGADILGRRRKETGKRRNEEEREQYRADGRQGG